MTCRLYKSSYSTVYHLLSLESLINFLQGAVDHIYVAERAVVFHPIQDMRIHDGLDRLTDGQSPNGKCGGRHRLDTMRRIVQWS